jgi:hypothetical protein
MIKKDHSDDPFFAKKLANAKKRLENIILPKIPRRKN